MKLGPFTAWQLIGWEGPHGRVRRVGGRKTYCLVNHNMETMRGNNVRLDDDAGKGCQYVDGDARVEIAEVTREGIEFLEFQGLIDAEEARAAKLCT